MKAGLSIHAEWTCYGIKNGQRILIDLSLCYVKGAESFFISMNEQAIEVAVTWTDNRVAVTRLSLSRQSRKVGLPSTVYVGDGPRPHSLSLTSATFTTKTLENRENNKRGQGSYKRLGYKRVDVTIVSACKVSAHNTGTTVYVSREDKLYELIINDDGEEIHKVCDGRGQWQAVVMDEAVLLCSYNPSSLPAVI
ncbi:hypothetical protein J6590_037355 [Homalodisca vitripennis]|nr:hypothetical protein J6590_037355 [Homalodisca vitripennis]